MSTNYPKIKSNDRDPKLKIQKQIDQHKKQDLKKQDPKIRSKGRDPKLKIQKKDIQNKQDTTIRSKDRNPKRKI